MFKIRSVDLYADDATYREYEVSVFDISSLPGNALRTLVDIVRLSERFNMHSQSQVW